MQELNKLPRLHQAKEILCPHARNLSGLLGLHPGAFLQLCGRQRWYVFIPLICNIFVFIFGMRCNLNFRRCPRGERRNI